MATTTLRPNAAGDRTEAAPIGAANNWDCVDEDPANDATDYITTATAASPDEDLYNLPASGIAAGSVIDEVRVYFRTREQGASPVGLAGACIKENGVDTVGTMQNQTSSWANWSEAWTTRPSDGQPWTVEDLDASGDALQIGVRHTCSDVGSVQTTQVYVVVTHRRESQVIIIMPQG